MKEIAIQKTHNGIIPFSREDWEKLSEYKPNQILRAKITGAKKQRSYQQLKLFWACCRTVAENCREKDTKFDTSDKVAFQVKVALDFRDPKAVAVRPDGTVQFMYRSISFAELPHMEAQNFFERAFEFMSRKIGVRKEELLANAEA